MKLQPPAVYGTASGGVSRENQNECKDRCWLPGFLASYIVSIAFGTKKST